MIDNKDEDNNLLHINKNKLTFLGFITGLLPYILIMGIISLNAGGTKYIPTLYRTTLVTMGLVTAVINSIVLRNMYKNYNK